MRSPSPIDDVRRTPLARRPAVALGVLQLGICACLVAVAAACRPPAAEPAPTATPTGAPREAPAPVPPEPLPLPAPSAEAETLPPRPPRTLYRSELRRATSRGPAFLLRGLGPPEPVRERGMFRGWRVLARFPEDPGLCGPDCDLQVGDVIVSVNGNTLERPEQLMKLVASVPELRELVVVRKRPSSSVVESLTYRIDDTR